MLHVLLGTFTKGQLSLGQLCYVSTISFINAEFPKVTFTTPTVEGQTYTFDDKRTRYHACNSPLIPDPYEMGTIAIKKSKLHGSGEGLFLKVDVPAGRIIAFYNGVTRNETEQTEREIVEDKGQLVSKCPFGAFPVLYTVGLYSPSSYYTQNMNLSE